MTSFQWELEKLLDYKISIFFFFFFNILYIWNDVEFFSKHHVYDIYLFLQVCAHRWCEIVTKQLRMVGACYLFSSIKDSEILTPLLGSPKKNGVFYQGMAQFGTSAQFSKVKFSFDVVKLPSKLTKLFCKNSWLVFHGISTLVDYSMPI